MRNAAGGRDALQRDERAEHHQGDNHGRELRDMEDQGRRGRKVDKEQCRRGYNYCNTKSFSWPHHREGDDDDGNGDYKHPGQGGAA